MDNRSIRRAFNKAIQALGTMSDDQIEKFPLLDHTLILNALPVVDELAHIRKQLTERLRLRLSVSWIENGDIGEVFSILAALWQYNPKYITGEHLVCALQRLIKSEVAVGGPYYSCHKAEIIANVQAATFIRLTTKALPNMENFFANIVLSRRLDSTSLTSFGLLYLLAKASDAQEITQHVASCWKKDEWQSAGRKAIALSVLKDHIPWPEIEQALAVVCNEQQRNGFWGEETLIGLSAQRTSHFTLTALVAETLNDYQGGPKTLPDRELWRRRRAVARLVRDLFNDCSEPLRSSVRTMVTRVCNADRTFEITLLPYLFADALKGPVLLTAEQCTMLSLASVCAWTAYTIYDDFLDNEGIPSRLPVANIAMRTSLNCFQRVLPTHNDFQLHIKKVFIKMDEANAWELKHCRFTLQANKVSITSLPRYGSREMLAARSFGYVIVPIAILMRQPSTSAAKLHAITLAFKHYLIARQLNDDLHDWLHDMQAGQASYVVTAILRDMHVKPGVYDLPTLLPTMQKRFRMTTMLEVCRRMLWHLSRSRQYFTDSQVFQKTNKIYSLLDSLENIAQQSIDQQIKARAFTSAAEN